MPLGKLLQKVHFFSAEDSQRRISRLLDLNASLISKISRHLQDGCPRDSGQANHALCNSRQFDVNSTFYSIRSTTLSTPFEYNTVQEILTNKQVSLSVTLKTAEISVMLP